MHHDDIAERKQSALNANGKHRKSELQGLPKATHPEQDAIAHEQGSTVLHFEHDVYAKQGIFPAPDQIQLRSRQAIDFLLRKVINYVGRVPQLLQHEQAFFLKFRFNGPSWTEYIENRHNAQAFVGVRHELAKEPVVFPLLRLIHAHGLPFDATSRGPF